MQHNAKTELKFSPVWIPPIILYIHKCVYWGTYPKVRHDFRSQNLNFRRAPAHTSQSFQTILGSLNVNVCLWKSAWSFLLNKKTNAKIFLKIKVLKSIYFEKMSELLISSFLLSDLSESLRSLTKNERCDRIAQVTHQKWANMSDLLRLLRGNERLWANRSGRSPKLSKWVNCNDI